MGETTGTEPSGNGHSSSGGLTNRWSGRVDDKVPSPYNSGRAAQLNR
jgi:hypothetical protein